MTVPESSGPRCASERVARSKTSGANRALRETNPAIPHTARIILSMRNGENYQTRHAFCLTMGWPALQLNVRAKSGLFCRTPFTR